MKDVTGEVTIVSSDGSRRTERIDAAWVERNIPAFDGGRPLPPPAAVPAADAVEVFDASPGELAETEPFTVLSRSVLVFFAEKPGPCRFVIRQVNMVPGRALSKRPLIVEPVGGGRSKEIAAPGEKPIEVVYHAAKRGFYKVVVPRWGTRLRIDSTSVPLALHAARPVKIAAMKGKPFALTFGIDGSPFTFFAKGGDYYRFKVQMFDTAGGAMESRDIAKDQFTAHEKAGECAGFRKVAISRAAKPHYDHISLQLFGGEGFFFLTDKKRWR